MTTVRKARTEDIVVIKRIADANRYELGFVLSPALIEGIERGWLLVAEGIEQNIIGFIHYRHCRKPRTTLYEICVDKAYRRNGVGSLLLEALLNEAQIHGSEFVSLKAPVDIAANNFYAQRGFSLSEVLIGKKRNLNLWKYELMERHRENDSVS